MWAVCRLSASAAERRRGTRARCNARRWDLVAPSAHSASTSVLEMVEAASSSGASGVEPTPRRGMYQNSAMMCVSSPMTRTGAPPQSSARQLRYRSAAAAISFGPCKQRMAHQHARVTASLGHGCRGAHAVRDDHEADFAGRDLGLRTALHAQAVHCALGAHLSQGGGKARGLALVLHEVVQYVALAHERRRRLEAPRPRCMCGARVVSLTARKGRSARASRRGGIAVRMQTTHLRRCARARIAPDAPTNACSSAACSIVPRPAPANARAGSSTNARGRAASWG